MKTVSMVDEKDREFIDCGVISKFEYDVSDLNGNLIQKLKSDFDIKIDDVILLNNNEPFKVQGRILTYKHKNKCTLIGYKQ